MVSTRRSSFSVPSLPSTVQKPVVAMASKGSFSGRPPLSIKRETSQTPLPPRPPKPSSSASSLMSSSKSAPAQKIHSSSSIAKVNVNSFLHSINLHDCNDLLSLPDPPSPSKRQRRRLSSPLLDVTNSHLNNSSRSKKHRQSLSHVPSPKELISEQVTEATSTTKELDFGPGDFSGGGHKRRRSLCHIPASSPKLDFDSEKKHYDSARKHKRSESKKGMDSLSRSNNAEFDFLGALDIDTAVAANKRKRSQSLCTPRSLRESVDENPAVDPERADETLQLKNDATIDAKTQIRLSPIALLPKLVQETPKQELDFSGAKNFEEKNAPEWINVLDMEGVHCSEQDLPGAGHLTGEISKVLNQSTVNDSKPLQLKESASQRLDLSGALDFESFQFQDPVSTKLDLTGAVDYEQLPATEQRNVVKVDTPNDNQSHIQCMRNNGIDLSQATSETYDAKLQVNAKMSSARRKKRQSFFVPRTPDVDDIEKPDFKEEASEVAGPTECHSVGLKTSSAILEEGKYESLSKRRKKRQSIFLPCDVDDDESNEVVDFFQSMPKTREKKSHPRHAAKEIGDSADDEMARIRSLVRSYTLLSVAERGSSDQAHEIQKLTGYPLVGRPAQSGSCTAEQKFERRSAMFTELGPIVEKMEMGKNTEKAVYQQGTGIRFERTRTGRYRYFGVENNTRVSPLDYQEVYLEQVKKINAEKGISIRQFLRSYDPQVWGTDEARQDNESEERETRILETDDLEEDNEMDISESPQDPENDEFQTDDPEPIKIVGTRHELLPLPPRDELPEDPDIAEAHRRLWDAIDDALDAYSRRVFAIQAADLT